MASIINADNGSTSGTAGITTSSDGTGVLQLQTNGVTGIQIDTAQNVTLAGTGYATLPIGTTAQRPVSATAGMIRYNNTLGYPEWYDVTATSWKSFSTGAGYSIELLIVAGGGAGQAGGGGAGGLLYYGAETPKTPNGNALLVSLGSIYTITIGAGGSGAQGANSVFSGGSTTYTAIGGGRGGQNDTSGPSSYQTGGSGGGGGRTSTVNPANGGPGTTGQGNAGGNTTNNSSPYPGSGGGGAGAVGNSQVSANQSGSGGIGLQYSISGTATYYAGGGGGGHDTGTAGAGGLGGGGAGTSGSSGTGNAGTANTGGGGGGGSGNGAAGGSGIVILRYLGTPKGTGGTVTQVGGYTIHKFTASGTFTA